ncbi:hypothetical protein [Mycolicibacterium hodleri]|uniref:Uncharacterized protein n=1 Tax=Mycolicibacterium hodleri TaxID=49897 RepID=A0A502EAE7_9MYCO|nr:hypothetical protein [Mycolicibacterium hodleri]TPG34698.1 hypothetical protein EAH80_12805 [Mycolicibacterium hodleri]
MRVTHGAQNRAEQVEHLRRKMAEVAGRTAGTMGSTQRGSMPSRAALPASETLLSIPESLADLLPDALPRGAVAVLSGARSLPLRLVAAVTAAGGHAAIVGQPNVGLLAAVEMGADLSRLAVIPDAGADPVEVAAVLMDGLDLVVLGLGGRAIAPARARAVTARARQKGCTLLVVNGDWHGASARLESRVCGYEVTGAGAGAPTPGCGRISRVRLATKASGRFVGHARVVGG